MHLPFKAAGLPMVLGSLPYTSPSQALGLLRRHTNALLAWPQLPLRGFREQSLVQAMVGFPGLVIDAQRGHISIDRRRAEEELNQVEIAYLKHDLEFAANTEEEAAGFFELTRQREAIRGTVAIKGQLLGPISAAAQLIDEQNRPIIYDPMLFEALTHFLCLRATWQYSRLAELSPTTIICLDEPFLDAIGLSFLPIDWEIAQAHIDLVFSGISGCRAIYAGGAAEWAKLMQTSADLIIADIYSHPAGLQQAAAELSEYLERGGMIGLGITPADEEALARESPESLLRRIESLLNNVQQRGVSGERLIEQCVLTPSDMIGRLAPESAEHVLQVLAETSRLVRERYGLETVKHVNM
jgi:hypothetical protein